METMTRVFLALMFSFLSLVAPSSALCSFEQASESACCCVADTDCAVMTGTCCGLTDELPIGPPPVSGETMAGSAVYVPQIVLAASAAVVRSIGWRKWQKTPLHLASNKLYLEKRSLLI